MLSLGCGQLIEKKDAISKDTSAGLITWVKQQGLLDIMMGGAMELTGAIFDELVHTEVTLALCIWSALLCSAP